MLQPPVNLDQYRVNFPGGFGEGGSASCSPLTYAILGAVAFWAIPPLLSGVFHGAREEYRNQRRGR